MATNENILRENILLSSAKGRLTKARNQLKSLLNTQLYGQLTSKNTIRRAINKVSSEYDIIEKIINALKEIYAVSTSHDENTDTLIENLDKELEEIGALVDESQKLAYVYEHIKGREDNGETVSVSLSTISKLHSVEEQTHPEVKEANDRFLQIQEEQRRQEEELEQRHIELKDRLLHFQQEQRQKEDELQKRI